MSKANIMRLVLPLVVKITGDFFGYSAVFVLGSDAGADARIIQIKPIQPVKFAFKPVKPLFFFCFLLCAVAAVASGFAVL